MPTDLTRPDTDAQDPNSGYPKTVNDYLALLSDYWADVLDVDDVPSDEVFARWERQARPVIERMTKESAERIEHFADTRRLLAWLGDPRSDGSPLPRPEQAFTAGPERRIADLIYGWREAFYREERRAIAYHNEDQIGCGFLCGHPVACIRNKPGGGAHCIMCELAKETAELRAELTAGREEIARLKALGVPWRAKWIPREQNTEADAQSVLGGQPRNPWAARRDDTPEGRLAAHKVAYQRYLDLQPAPTPPAPDLQASDPSLAPF